MTPLGFYTPISPFWNRLSLFLPRILFPSRLEVGRLSLSLSFSFSFSMFKETTLDYSLSFFLFDLRSSILFVFLFLFFVGEFDTFFGAEGGVRRLVDGKVCSYSREVCWC